jgi:hypothetical protein
MIELLTLFCWRVDGAMLDCSSRVWTLPRLVALCVLTALDVGRVLLERWVNLHIGL